MSLLRSRLVLRYILGEMIPSFVLGVVVFVFILLMFQALRLTEFVLVHGVSVSTLLEIMAYLSTSFLPLIFPMSLLFTVLMTYGRMSADSEVVAFKAIGLSTLNIITPAIVFSILVATLSAQTSFHIAPWGNRQFEVLITKLGSMKAGVTLKEGTFSEGFFDLVVYANKVDSKRGRLNQVFIYDEREANTPVTVIAREGILMKDPNQSTAQSASLQLVDGSIHRMSDGRHTKVDFSTYTIHLSNPVTEAFRSKSPQSMTLEELQKNLTEGELPDLERRRLHTEFHKRWAISLACLLFAMIGAGLGTTANRRAARGGGMVICLALIVAYWVLYISSETLAKNGTLPVAPAIWLPNAIFLVAAVFSLRSAWR